MTADRLLLWCAVGVLLIFGFLPIVNWIPGGHEAPWYVDRVREWLMDGVLVLGVGVLLAMVSKRVTWLWRPGWWAPIAESAALRPALTGALIGVGAFLLYAVIARLVFSSSPLHVDEIIQVWQARVLASGRLWVPTPEFPEFTSAMHLVDHQGRRFGQFPMGGPAMLAIGSLLRAEWLVGPLFGAASAMLAWRLFRRIEPRGGVALAAAILFALAPFTAFMAGSHMNHVTTLTWLLVAMLGLARATGTQTPRWQDGLLCGLGLGVAATIRPVDAAAFALPAAVWLIWQAVQTRRFGAFLMSGVGVAVPVALLFAANAATTGHPLLFGYTVLWGSAHDLGFHTTPWGDVHSPRAGLELISLYFLRLQLYFLEAPIPALVPAAVALLLARRLTGFDRYLLVSSGLLLGLYWAYWHDGFYLGPRFTYPLVPGLALWTARGLPALLNQYGSGTISHRAVVLATLACVPLLLVNVTTIRGQQYRNALQTMRFDADKAARDLGVRDAVIFVRESWGSEVIARLWALGVSRGDAEQLYRRVDTCLLDLALLELEATWASGHSAMARLTPLLADSARVVPSGLSPDRTQRALDGATYPPRCLNRIKDDWQGFTLFTPQLLAGDAGNLFLRDLRERNALVGDLTEGHGVYRLQPEGPVEGIPPQLLLVRPDGSEPQ